MAEPPEPEHSEIDPEDFLRALLAMSPEDAKQAREDAAKAMEGQSDRDA